MDIVSLLIGSKLSGGGGGGGGGTSAPAGIPVVIKTLSATPVCIPVTINIKEEE